MPEAKLRVGVSACLLGQEVRWDGRHRRDAFLVDVLGEHVEWVPVCPELEVGMGVPREPIRLEGSPRAPRLVAERSRKDHTEAMSRLADARVRALAALGLAGFVVKTDSPSCGLAGVPVHPARGAGTPRRAGVGAFTRVLLARMPLLPVEDEARLSDPAVRDAFVERIFAHARQEAVLGRGSRRGDLARFHAANALTLEVHDPAACRRLGRLVEARGPLAGTIDAYRRGFAEALRVPATRGRHAQVLRRLLIRLRGVLAAPDRIELAEAVRDHARGLAPLVVPLTLIRHHVRRQRIAGLEGQAYLEPDPRELALRYHA